MWSFITTHVQEIASISAAISAFLAFLGLCYAGYQFRRNTKTRQQMMYLDFLDRYYELRKMLIADSELASIYAENFNASALSVKQRYYICCLIAFCEGLFITRQIDVFKDIAGGNWQNFIKHTFSNHAVRKIWEELTQIPEKSDFALDFINFVNRLLNQ